jgi:hypothetical protein
MVNIGIVELNPINIFIIAENRRPVVIMYLALYLSPISPKKHFPTPYNTAANDMIIPISVFVI